MNFKKIFLTMIFGLVFGFVSINAVSAAEIVTQEDIQKKVVVEDDFIKLADNFMVLFDASNSMKRQYKKGMPESRYNLAKAILIEKVAALPDLGYNAGLYLYTPYKELAPMGPLNKRSFWVFSG